MGAISANCPWRKASARMPSKELVIPAGLPIVAYTSRRDQH